MNIAEKVLEKALFLPTHYRALIAEKLLESLDSECDFTVSDEWKKEIQTRCKAIDSKRVKLILSEKVFEKAYNLVK